VRIAGGGSPAVMCILEIAYDVIRDGRPYHELGAGDFGKRHAEPADGRHVRQLDQRCAHRGRTAAWNLVSRAIQLPLCKQFRLFGCGTNRSPERSARSVESAGRQPIGSPGYLTECTSRRDSPA
jgi:hypothetical protein